MPPTENGFMAYSEVTPGDKWFDKNYDRIAIPCDCVACVERGGLRRQLPRKHGANVDIAEQASGQRDGDPFCLRDTRGGLRPHGMFNAMAMSLFFILLWLPRKRRRRLHVARSS